MCIRDSPYLHQNRYRLMATAESRIYTTTDGRYVTEDDPDAAFLAYPAGAEIPAQVAEQLKQAKRPADKQLSGHEDKAVSRRDDKTVREWALAQGLDVPKRGPIPDVVIELYDEAHRGRG